MLTVLRIEVGSKSSALRRIRDSTWSIASEKLVLKNFNAFVAAGDETDKRYGEWHVTDCHRWRIFYYVDLCLLRFDMEFDNPSAFNWSLEVEWIIRFYSSDFEHTWMEAPVKQHFSSDDPCRNLIWFPASICTERRYVNDDDVMVVGFDLRFKANKMDIRFTQLARQLEQLQCGQRALTSKVNSSTLLLLNVNLC
ncbi:unnamed protein product [Toxocara canis]|uniref:MATH domain-containing protein n=1 Tax=Toxocara canis TaxID=6265 RepID=A0A183UZU1_TOXCA|nr:unnamed protein product [Toxocara canis]